MDESSLLSSLHKENIVPNLSLVSKALKSSLPSSVKPKRGQWYSPCSSPRPKQPHSPDDYLPILKLTHFEKTPRVLFNSVKLGSSKIEELVVWNPNPVSQTLRVEKCPSKLGFFVECSGYRDDETGKSVLTLEPDEELVLPIKWEPKEAGKYREMIVFKWNETHRLQTILIGTAVDLKTKKKRPSILGLSQAFNTKAPKKTCKPPQFSVLTKDAKPTKEKPECNFEFGKRLPEVKEEVSKENAEERRETYVVKCGSPANLNKKPENLQTEKQHINVNKANTKKEIEENNLHTYKLVEKKIDSIYEQKPVSKPRISIPAWKGVDELEKIKTKSDIIKEEKVVPNATAFSVEPINKKVKSTKSTLKSQQKKTSAQKPQESSSLKKTRKVKLKVASHGVAPTKLKLARPPKTSIPRHPMPFAAKNMYYDERWIEKQEEGFTRWMNFVLTPPDDCDVTSKTNSRRDQSIMSLIGTKSMQSSQPKAPSKEELSLKAYTARRKMSRLRRLACLLYQSEPVICVLRKLEAEVEEGRIAIRPDKKMHADLGIKNNIIGMLLSYNPLWLRIGLETIFGEIIPIKTNSDVHSLSRYVSDRLLGNPDIARTYAHPKVPGLYREGYVQQLSKFTLKKFLFLVLFLDRAKLTRLIDHDPCLFVKDADFKSSRSLLLTFSREYLKGEGDITKHLSYLGFSVSHEQRPIDEFNYAVTNIATDLRDGLRLTRIVELLTHNWKLTQSLRVPAISRLQKIHNVEVFMKALKEHKIPLEGTGSGIDPRHVVDGHREKTLQLLWLIIFNFQVNILLNEKQLNEEISFLEQNQDLVNRLETMTVDVTKLLGLPRSKRESLESNVYFKSPRLRLLLKWCRLICKLYGMKIENFTVSFSDGRALCYLLHYYHPYLLPLDMIKQDTTLTRNPGVHDNSDSEEEEGIITDSWAGNYSPGSGRNLEIERLKANERENFKLLAQKVQALGGVPLMAKFADMSNTIPDEKVVITYTSYLCARLLDLREETRAARTIQVAWKKYLLRKYLEKRRILNDAAVVVQSYARGAMVRRRFIKLKNAAILIQSAYRGYCARLEIYLQRKAAMRIQAKFRATRSMCCEREEFLRCKKAVISMQALVRGKMCRNKMSKIRAAVKIQAMWRCHEKRVSYLETRKAALVCQKLTKGSGQRKKYLRLRAASVTIQSHFRAVKARNKEQAKYDRTRKAIVTIQACYRGHQARVRVKNIRAAVTIQKYFKMRKYRSFFLKQREAVIKIQAQVRRFFAQKKYVGLKNAVCVIQRRFKAYSIGQEQRENYKKMRSCCVKIQALQRGYFARKRFLILKNSTIKIQAALRRMIAQTYYRKLQNSVLIIQKHYRSYLLMKQVRFKYISNKYAAITIQAFYRRHQCRRSFLATKLAALQVQAFIRGYQERKKFRKLKNSVVVLQRRYLAMRMGREERLVYHIKRGAMITIQAAVRGFFVRQCIKRQHFAATAIQATFRCFAARKKYTCLKSSVVIIQQRYRAYLIGKAERDRYLSSKDAALTIQAFFRTKYRANVASKIIRGEYLCLRNSVIVIQCAFRSMKARELATKMQAARTIQSLYRMYVVRKNFLLTREAVVRIQAYEKMRKASREYSMLKSAVLTCQRLVRANQQCKEQRAYYTCLRKNVILMQSIRRGNMARCRVKQMVVEREKANEAAAKIQNYFRGYLQMRYLYLRFRYIRRAIITIQSVYRGHVAREYTRRVKAASIIQACYRGSVARRSYHLARQSIIYLQAVVRCHQVRVNYLRMKRAAVVCQQRYKATRRMKEELRRYQHTKEAITRIQAVWRGHMARGTFCNTLESIVMVQSLAKMYIARKRFNQMRNSVMVLQCRYRALCLGRAVRRDYSFLKNATITIQSFYRGYQTRRYVRQVRSAQIIQRRFRAVRQGLAVRREYAIIKKSVLVIQAAYRGYKGRKEARLNEAAIIIQANVRGYIVREQIKRLKEAQFKRLVRFASAVHYNLSAIRIQRAFKQAQALKLAKKQINSVLFIQCWWRATLLRRRFLAMRKAAILIQRATRRNRILKDRAATRIQSIARVWLARRTVAKMITAAVRIQALWRGYQLRRRVTSLKIKAARRRIRVANNAATESMKLCNRTRSALDYLLRCKNLTTIFDVLVNLEVVTRLSYVCCEQLVKDQALRVIFTVIRNSNRSVPHMEILKYALAILINLAKCPTTYRAVYEEQDSLMTLLELISIFREKEQIFSKTCCLLTILGRRDNGILEEMLNTPKMTDKIKSAHYLITRKTKLVKRRSVIKAKMAQSTPYKSAPPSTPCRQTPFKSHTPFKARRISEWAMWQEYVNKVQDPLQSVRSLMRTLHIEYEEPNVN